MDRNRAVRLTSFFACAWALAASAFGQVEQKDELSDIDAFMERVLEKRDVNWTHYYQYFGRERSELTIEGGIDEVPLQGSRREYLWYVRDGYLVKSPVSVDGVAVSAEEREREELAWIERTKKREKERGADRETFMGFEFEPGNYLFAGRQEFEGRELVVVEYYPEAMFETEDVDDDSDLDERIETALNKVFLVTLLIDPEEHQIVRMTLDNYGFDFLPGSWLVQLETVEATMVMHKPFEDIWLPRDISVFGKVRTAVGSLSVRYDTTFYEYTKTETSVTFTFPPRGAGGTNREKKRRK